MEGGGFEGGVTCLFLSQDVGQTVQGIWCLKGAKYFQVGRSMGVEWRKYLR